MKFLKKHFTKFIMSFTLVFTCLFVAFGFNTYAYSIDTNGNLVGDNILDISSYEITYRNNVDLFVDNNLMKITASSGNTFSYIVLHFTNTNFETNMQYTISFYGSTTNPSSYNYINFKYADGPSEDNPYYRQNINTENSTLYQGTFNSGNNTSLYLLIYVNASLLGDNTITLNNIMINKGTYKEWEPYGVWYSQNNYDYQVNKYQSLLDSIYPFNKDLFSINNVEYNSYDITDDYIDSYDYTIEFNGNAFNFNTRDFDYLPNNLSSQGMNHFFMVIVYNKSVTANTLSFKIDLSHTKESRLNISFYNDSTIVTSTGDLDNENSSNFFTEYNTFSFNKLMINLYISADETQYNHYSSVVSGGTYAEGYSQASVYYNSQLSSLSDMISIRDDKILSLDKSIRALQTAYNDLNQSYQNMLNGNNFANLFFTIAETPFASFKQIWNIDFLGVNLAGFVTGILFLGLIIWVIKKIF